ncbi:MAG TPA: fumarylacetoacetate hydrolase family protein [Mucilaginibacter sp.]|jgi:2-dehydro-3-deoxy-D-arabinonate dehydratase|nr:fumarylacetoacetate hydrolase family protein [Mucilaginibacter sp.]
MKLYRLRNNIILDHDGKHYLFEHPWDALIDRDDLFQYLAGLAGKSQVIPEEQATELISTELLPPIGSQEVWAAGVTYLRSREARMEESAGSGAADLYDRVYAAERPELFFKSMPHRVAGHRQQVYIRRDSIWNVPEPELTLFINSNGNIQGYTVGNDMSSRSIEGENALYLPQAKIFERSAAMGPCIYVPELPMPADSKIKMNIQRDGRKVYEDETSISRMKRSLTELAGYLFRECDFHHGCFLMTGTCLVPPNDFTLQPDDIVSIEIDHIGLLVNTVNYKP